MAELNIINGSERRRSARLTSPPPPREANGQHDNKMALPSAAVKRSITVRKIAPRKTVAPSENNKENTPRRSGRSGSEGGQQQQQQGKPKISTPGSLPVQGRGPSSSVEKVKKKAAMPSPILPSSPPPGARPLQPVVEQEDPVWSKKVRRSYSRLSEKSFNTSADCEDNMFGFGNLKTPEVIGRIKKAGLEVSAASVLSGINSFTSLLDADDCGSAAPEPDLNIPGVVMVKEKRRRKKKVPQLNVVELDAMAAQMNAEFDEAEVFELVVE